MSRRQVVTDERPGTANSEPRSGSRSASLERSSCAARPTHPRRSVRGFTWRAQAATDDGAIGLFGIGLTFCVCLLIGGGVAVGSAQIARVDVLDAADHASASAADRLALATTYNRGVAAAALDPEQARTEAARVLGATPRPAHVSSWHVANVRVEGEQVVVTVQAVVDPPVIGSALSALGAPIGVTITSRADAHLQR